MPDHLPGRVGLLLLLSSLGTQGCPGEAEKGAPGHDSGGESAETGALAPVDADGDGFLSDVDCADDDPEIHPGVTEHCGNDVDEDCDGIDSVCLSGDVSVADAEVIINEVKRATGAGWELSGAGDVNGDGYDDFIVGAPDWSEDYTISYAPGAAYVVLGGTSWPEDLRSSWLTLRGTDDDHWVGMDVGGPGDLDDDGLPDVLVGSAKVVAHEYLSSGAAYLFSGLAGGEWTTEDAEAQLTGVPDERTLARVAQGHPADLTEDGALDAVVFGQDIEGDQSAMAWVCEGPLSGTSTVEDCGTTIIDNPEKPGVWESGEAADVTGDGIDDLIVGAYGDCRSEGCPSSGDSNGAVYIFDGPLSGTLTASETDQELVGNAPGDQAGRSVTVIGDGDGDGYLDLAVGAPYESTAGRYAGAAYLARGPVEGSTSLTMADATFYGASETWDSNKTGWEIAGPGDVDGDEVPDVLISAFRWTEESVGLVHLVDGSSSGVFSLSTAGSRILGEAGDDGAGAGATLSGVGDVNADGLQDFILCDPWFGDEVRTVYSRIYVMFGAVP